MLFIVLEQWTICKHGKYMLWVQQPSESFHCRNYIYVPSNDFYACSLLHLLKVILKCLFASLYQRVPYQMVHYWPFGWFDFLLFIGSWIVVILVNRVMSQIIGLASVGVSSHKS